MDTLARELLAFWRHAGPARWFVRDDGFDAQLRERFLAAHHAAARREYEAWMDTPEGALALLVLLDQVPRNCYRDSAHAWAADGLARHYARQALAAGHDRAMETSLRMFFYLPF